MPNAEPWPTTVLRELGHRIAYDGHGYELAWGYDEYTERVRIQRGGGIAGQGNIWTICNVTTGRAVSPPCHNKKELRRAILAWETSEPEPSRPGYTYYPRRHSTRLTDSTIWVQRKAKPTT